MATVSDTAYPRLPSTISPPYLKRLFSITRRERRWLSTLRVGSSARRDTAVFLKCLQCLGYFPRSSAIPAVVVEFVCSELRLDHVSRLSPNQRAAHRIKQAVRDFSRVTLFSPREHELWLFDFACQMATTKERSIDIINAMIEILVKESFELPGFSTLDR